MASQKILIIEDDNFTRDLYEEVLKDAGYEIDAAADGETGLVKIRQGGYSLVLLDMMLPKLDGLGVLRAVNNENLHSKNGKIILVTNLAHDPVIKLAQDLGVSSYLIKSDVNPGQLVEKIKGFLAEAS